MGDNDKPFVCTHAGCSMRFANEDHLSVHRLKHEMSLALTPGAKHSMFLPLADQTPTPTKFLKNCEEIGLFSELTKNPFEEAFKKASDTMSEGKMAEVLSITGLETLNTPSPHMGAASSHSPIVPVTTPKKHREFVPLPGPDNDMGSTIAASTPSGESPGQCSTPRTPSSSVRTLGRSNSSSSTPVGTPTSSSMGLPFKLRLKREPLGENELSLMPGGVVSPSVSKAGTPMSDQSPIKPEPPNVPRKVSKPPSLESPIIPLAPAINIEPEPTAVVAQPSGLSSNPAKIAMVTPTPMVPSISSPPMNSSMTVPVSSTTDPSNANTTAVPYLQVGPNNQPQCYLQVMIQMPSGEMMPVQIPAALSSASTVANSTPSLTTISKSAAPEVAASSTNIVTTSNTVMSQSALPPAGGSGAASISTKQKLKAALQQSVLSSNMRIMSEAVDRVMTVPQQTTPKSAIKLTSPSGSSTMMDGVPKILTNMVPGQQIPPQTSPASSVTTPLSEMGDFDDDDDDDMTMEGEDGDEYSFPKRARREDGHHPDDRRKKFLERNRAAAARCRQKKKMWIGSLEKKAEELQNTNSKLQQEVTMLRSEVAQLKTLLLAHKDCPITQQLQGAGLVKTVSAKTNQQSMCLVNNPGTSDGHVKNIVPGPSTTEQFRTYTHDNTTIHTSQSAGTSALKAIHSDTIHVKRNSLELDSSSSSTSSRTLQTVASSSAVIRTIQSVAPLVIEFNTDNSTAQ